MNGAITKKIRKEVTSQKSKYTNAARNEIMDKVIAELLAKKPKYIPMALWKHWLF